MDNGIEMQGARCPRLECRLIIHNALTAHCLFISLDRAMPRIAAPHRIRLISFLLMKLYTLAGEKFPNFLPYLSTARAEMIKF